MGAFLPCKKGIFFQVENRGEPFPRILSIIFSDVLEYLHDAYFYIGPFKQGLIYCYDLALTVMKIDLIELIITQLSHSFYFNRHQTKEILL